MFTAPPIANRLSYFGRFMTPDPTGGHRFDPQSLNKYVYALDNPVSLTDPTGLDVWLQGCGKNSNTCQNNFVGTTDKHGQFHRTHLKGDLRKTATIDGHGMHVTYNGHSYTGVWDTNKSEQNHVFMQGTGALKGFTVEMRGTCTGCTGTGILRDNTSGDPSTGRLASAAEVMKALSAPGSGFVRQAGTDRMDFFHPGATNFRGHVPGDPTGIPSTHIPIPNGWDSTFHIDGVYPYDSAGDWLSHAADAVHDLPNLF